MRCQVCGGVGYVREFPVAGRGGVDTIGAIAHCPACPNRDDTPALSVWEATQPRRAEQ